MEIFPRDALLRYDGRAGSPSGEHLAVFGLDGLSDGRKLVLRQKRGGRKQEGRGGQKEVFHPV